MTPTFRSRRPAPALLLSLALSPLLTGISAPARAAVWTDAAEPVSGDGPLSRTTPSLRYAALLPDRSLYAVWYTRIGESTTQVRGGSRAAGGAWITEPAPISLGSGLSRLPVLAAGAAGDLHVAWIDNRDGNEEIYYRQRDAAGAWGDEVRVTFTPQASIAPTLAVAPNGRVLLAWSEGGPGHQAINVVSHGAGEAFGVPVAITDGRGNSENPMIATDASSEAHLVWQDNIIDPIVNVDDPANVEIYYERIDAAGQPASAPFRISNAIGRSQRPTLAVEPNGTIHVFWCDDRDRGPGSSGGGFPIAIWYRRGLPGLGFGHEKRFAFNASDRLNPTVAVDGAGTINVAWEEYGIGNPEIYYRQIRPVTGWDPFFTRLTTTIGASQGPCLLAEASGTLHLLWSDLQSADALNVYYRGGQADATTPVTLAAFEVTNEAAGGLTVTWRTTEETDAAAFQLYGGAALDADAALLTPDAVPAGAGRYQVRISPEAAPPGARLRLVSVGRDGRQRVEAVRTVPAPDEPGGGVAPSAPRPNPSAGSVFLPVSAAVADAGLEMRVVDVRGRLVARLPVGGNDPAATGATWDGRDDSGQRVPAGRYFARAWRSGRPVGAPLAISRLP